MIYEWVNNGHTNSQKAICLFKLDCLQIESVSQGYKIHEAKMVAERYKSHESEMVVEGYKSHESEMTSLRHVAGNNHCR